MSIGNVPITIDLNKNHTTLITAANGLGKSSLSTDSICFALFGKPYRNINKPALINSINQKQMLVEVEFMVGKTTYLVKRGMKPSVFEIYENSKLVNQDPNIKDYQKVLEQQILRMNYRAFTQVVVMGSSAYIPFMRLTPQQRREFIEDLLDIRVFSVMNKLLSQKLKDNKELQRTIESDIKSQKEIIKVIESHVNAKRAESHLKQNELELEHARIKLENDDLTLKQTATQTNILELKRELEDLVSYEDEASDIEIKLKQMKSRGVELTETKSKHVDMIDCPTCGQIIPDNIKQSTIGAIQTEIQDIQSALDELAVLGQSIQVKLTQSSDLNAQITKLNAEVSRSGELIYGNNLVISRINSDLDKLVNSSSTSSDDKIKMRAIAKTIVSLDSQRKELSESVKLQQVAQALLQDSGIKSKIIKQYIPTINKIMNKYLNQLDLFVNFNLDENFNELIKSRHRDTFTYESFSQGEKQRIDLSIVFTWRAIAAMKNSVNTNLIIMDETFDSSLDETGISLVLEMFNGMKNNNIFVVSHRESIADKFNATVKLVKRNNFTMLE